MPQGPARLRAPNALLGVWNATLGYAGEVPELTGHAPNPQPTERKRSGILGFFSPEPKNSKARGQSGAGSVHLHSPPEWCRASEVRCRPRAVAREFSERCFAPLRSVMLPVRGHVAGRCCLAHSAALFIPRSGLFVVVPPSAAPPLTQCPPHSAAALTVQLPSQCSCPHSAAPHSAAPHSAVPHNSHLHSAHTCTVLPLTCSAALTVLPARRCPLHIVSYMHRAASFIAMLLVLECCLGNSAT